MLVANLAGLCRALSLVLGIGSCALWGAGCVQLLGIEDLPPGDRDGAPLPGPDALPAAPIDAAPPAADTDGDTVLDPDDNCPADPNPDQADCDADAVGDVCDPSSDGPDEDGDSVADTCDNCPSVDNPGQENIRDGDEVGDDCDPRPDEDGDTIEYFEGFATAGEGPPPGWTQAVGPELDSTTWVVQGNALLSEATERPNILYLSSVTFPADIVIETRASSQDVLVQFGEVASFGMVSRYTNGDPDDSGVMCVIEQELEFSPPPARVRILDFDSLASPDEQAPWRAEVGDVFTSVHVRHGRGAGSLTLCTAIPADTDRPPVQVSAVDVTGPENGQVGLRVVRSQPAVEYVLVYGLGGPPP
jgi:hypothetical protein